MYIVIDFEATCTNTNQFPRQEMEIIEIGAVLCQNKHHINVASFQAFVRPIRHPILTDFCTSLTSITQYQVDSAPLFPEMIQRLNDWMQMHDAAHATFCSWGDFDRHILLENCSYHNIEYPFMQHINLKQRFAIQQNCKPRGMASALQKVGIPLEGTHHRGIDDAQNISKLLQFCF